MVESVEREGNDLTFYQKKVRVTLDQARGVRLHT